MLTYKMLCMSFRNIICALLMALADVLFCLQ